MKKYISIVLCLLALPLGAEVSVITVTDENKHATKEDFYHTFEYFIKPEGGKGSKCQATRLAPHWFATAAHCVKGCSQGCTVQMDLLEGSVSVLAEVKHTAQNPTVFAHPDYQEKNIVQNDFALIHLDLNRAPKIYYRRATAKNPNNIVLREKEFTSFLAQHPRVRSQYRRALSPQLPPIAVFDNGNYELDRKVSIVSILEGKRNVLADPHPVYYVKDLGYAYTQNFGVRKGMSGSGVMTNTGELIGIISAYVGADLYRGNKKIKHQELFMFPVFNESFVRFMQEVMGSDFNRVEQKDAYPYLSHKTRKTFEEVKAMMKKSAK